MFQPRNTLVVVDITERPERKHGSIVIPTNGDLYVEGVVAAIGPGNVNAAGARSETFDLKVGQTVLVQHQQVRQLGSGLAKSKCGIEYTSEGRKYTLFEQTNILAILVESPLTEEGQRAALQAKVKEGLSKIIDNNGEFVEGDEE